MLTARFASSNGRYPHVTMDGVELWEGDSAVADARIADVAQSRRKAVEI
jgi:hypothetical protein